MKIRFGATLALLGMSHSIILAPFVYAAPSLSQDAPLSAEEQKGCANLFYAMEHPDLLKIAGAIGDRRLMLTTGGVLIAAGALKTFQSSRIGARAATLNRLAHASMEVGQEFFGKGFSGALQAGDTLGEAEVKLQGVSLNITAAREYAEKAHTTAGYLDADLGSSLEKLDSAYKKVKFVGGSSDEVIRKAATAISDGSDEAYYARAALAKMGSSMTEERLELLGAARGTEAANELLGQVGDEVARSAGYIHRASRNVESAMRALDEGIALTADAGRLATLGARALRVGFAAGSIGTAMLGTPEVWDVIAVPVGRPGPSQISRNPLSLVFDWSTKSKAYNCRNFLADANTQQFYKKMREISERLDSRLRNKGEIEMVLSPLDMKDLGLENISKQFPNAIITAVPDTLSAVPDLALRDPRNFMGSGSIKEFQGPQGAGIHVVPDAGSLNRFK